MQKTLKILIIHGKKHFEQYPSVLSESCGCKLLYFACVLVCADKVSVHAHTHTRTQKMYLYSM